MKKTLKMGIASLLSIVAVIGITKTCAKSTYVSISYNASEQVLTKYECTTDTRSAFNVSSINLPKGTQKMAVVFFLHAGDSAEGRVIDHTSTSFSKVGDGMEWNWVAVTPTVASVGGLTTTVDASTSGKIYINNGFLK